MNSSDKSKLPLCPHGVSFGSFYCLGNGAHFPAHTTRSAESVTIKRELEHWRMSFVEGGRSGSAIYNNLDHALAAAKFMLQDEQQTNISGGSDGNEDT